MATIPFDDRDGSMWFDGKLVPWREAKVHILSHSWHYGSAVFEGERAYGGKIFKMREHSERLLRSAKILDYEIPYTADEIDAAKMATLKANDLKDAYVRPIAWRGTETMNVSGLPCKIHLAIATWEWPPYYTAEARAKGARLIIGKWARPAPNTAPTSAKAAGLYMICTIGKNEADRQGAADVLMLDYRGNIAEATGSNFFMVKNGELLTPTPECILNGITRRTVMEIARGKGIPVAEKTLTLKDVEEADEVFLTGSAAEVTPVGQINDWKYNVGPITKTLLEAYDQMTRA